MNTHFKSALNKIEAEDDLIQKTEQYLRAKLESPKPADNVYHIRRPRYMKTMLASCIAAVFVICVFAGGYAFLKTPVAYISLDINPSVELGVNVLNNVVSVEGVNQDGKALLEGQNIININLSEALDRLINSATEKKYINEDGSTVVSITAESNNRKKALNLTDIGERAVSKSIIKRKISAVVYKDCSDLSLRTEAKQSGISPGKLKLIKFLQALDPTITVEQYKDAKVTDIMLKAKELVSALEDNDQLSETQKEAIKNLKDAAEKAKNRVKEAVKEKIDEVKEARDQAKAAYEEAKNQAKAIKDEAKDKAKELNDQAKDLLKNSRGKDKEQKEEIKEQAKELKKQAREVVKNANDQAKEIIEEAKKQKREAIKDAIKPKENTNTGDESSSVKEENTEKTEEPKQNTAEASKSQKANTETTATQKQNNSEPTKPLTLNQNKNTLI